eukprot:1506501-Rhodomonas_salina.3
MMIHRGFTEGRGSQVEGVASRLQALQPLSRSISRRERESEGERARQRGRERGTKRESNRDNSVRCCVQVEGGGQRTQ